jgi:predicted transposase YbfD/YdcC
LAISALIGGIGLAKIENTILLFKEMVSEFNITLPNEGVPKKPIRKLIRFFQTIEDARAQGMVSYPLHEILMVAFLAVMAGAGTMLDIAMFGSVNEAWLKKNFGIQHGIPSHDTFRRVLSLIHPQQLQKATVAFLLDNIKLLKRAFHIEGGGLRQYCVDGKTARGTGRLKGSEREIKQMHSLHVYDRTDGICLVSQEVGDKTNEIPVAKEMLRLLDLKESVVSFDAMNTQRDTIAVVVGQKGDYVAALKGNQRELYQEVRSFFKPSLIQRIEAGKTNYFEVREKTHSRIEIRKYYLSKNVSWLVQLQDWPGLKALIYYSLHTENINTGKTTDEVYCYISSLTDVELCADVIRGHWAVENQLHWHLDVNFLEDSTEIIDRYAFQNFSLLNKMALSLFKLIAPIQKLSVRSTKRQVGWNIDTLIKAFRILDEDILANAILDVKTKP